MVPLPLRATCAFVAVSLFLGAVAGLVLKPSALFLIPLFAAVLVVMPAMFGGVKPTSADLPRIDEQLQRFRSAMFACFAAAALIYGFVISARNALRELASLGVALWVVAFVLMFFVVYYRAQRRLAASTN